MTPEIIAHRGASYLAPENTLSAFRKAMEIGADGVEMDVQQTRDKKLVIHHDFVIDWHTDMRGQIYDMTEGELKALDFGSWKDVNYRNERIATLQEALALCREMEGTIVQLEMKATIDDDPDFVPRVIEEACSKHYRPAGGDLVQPRPAAAGKAADAGAEGGRAGLRCDGDHGAAH